MAALLLVVAPTPMSRAGPGREGVLGLAEWRFELGRMFVQQSSQKTLIYCSSLSSGLF
jgi:hypothetical protein